MYKRHGPQVQRAFSLIREDGILINKRRKRINTRQYNKWAAETVSAIEEFEESALWTRRIIEVESRM